MFLFAKTSNVFVAVIVAACAHTAFTIQSLHATEVLYPKPPHRRGSHHRSIAPKPGSFAALPNGGKIAILFRGQAFRSGGRVNATACEESRVSDQMRITQTALDNIVLPLELHSHTVDIYLVESGDCPLLHHVADLFGARVRVKDRFQGKRQVKGVLKVLEEFRWHAKPDSYKVVMMLRFDLLFKTSVYNWPDVNVDAFNFFSRCEVSPLTKEMEAQGGCVNDILYVMPGGYVPAFNKMINSVCWFGHGHLCYKYVVEKFGKEHVGFVTNEIPVWTRGPFRELEVY